VLAVVALVGLLVFGLVSKGSSRLEIGDPVPTRALPRLEGSGEGSLAEYRGRWVLVNIWASWCPPCRQETPALAEFQQRHAGPKFTVVGIDTRDLSDDGRKFVDSYGLGYPQLRDGNGEAAHEYGTSGVPESFLIDPAGKVRLHFAGPVGEEELEDEVAPLLPKVKS
jgi:cytochrome c biogenesis protein CcmG/thiol:disulfide interchange protein DsbE